MSLIVLFYEDDLVSYPPLCPSVWSRADLSPLSALHAALWITGRSCRLFRRRCGGDAADLCSWRAWRRSAGRWDLSDSLKAVFFQLLLFFFIYLFFPLSLPPSCMLSMFPCPSTPDSNELLAIRLTAELSDELIMWFRCVGQGNVSGWGLKNT